MLVLTSDCISYQTMTDLEESEYPRDLSRNFSACTLKNFADGKYCTNKLSSKYNYTCALTFMNYTNFGTELNNSLKYQVTHNDVEDDGVIIAVPPIGSVEGENNNSEKERTSTAVGDLQNCNQKMYQMAENDVEDDVIIAVPPTGSVEGEKINSEEEKTSAAVGDLQNYNQEKVKLCHKEHHHHLSSDEDEGDDDITSSKERVTQEEEKSQGCSVLLTPPFSPSFSPARIKSVSLTRVANLQGSLALVLLLSLELLASAAATSHVFLATSSVYTVGSRALFTCSAANCVGVQWLLNGTKLDSLNHTNCTSVFYEDISTGVLIVDPLSLEYNETTIQCEARFSSNTTLLSAELVILVQGLLSPVANLTYTLLNSMINLSWNAPFSLDIPGVDPDITYCVDIYNSTSSSLIDSKCDIIDTQYVYVSFPHLLACTEYCVNVIAVNIVGNSTATTLSIIWDKELNVTDVSATSVSNNKSIIRIIMLQYLCYTSVSVDIDGKAIPSLQDHFVQPNVIELSLDDNKQYNLIIHNQSSHMPFNISTYDVKTVQTGVVNNNTVDLNSTFITNSSAEGVLFMLININEKGNVNFPRSVYLPVARDNAIEGIEEFNVSQGSYTVLAYDIEEDASLQEEGLPAATTNMITVPGETIDSNQHGGDCDVDNNTGFSINIKCHCNESAYQVVLQRNDGSLDSVKKITTKRSLCSQSVFFEVPIEGLYCATVFHEKNGDGILGTKIYFAMEFEVNHLSTGSPTTTDRMSPDYNENSSSPITGGIVGALSGFFLICAIVLTLVVVSMFCVRKKKKKKNYSPSTTSDNHVYHEQHKFQANPYSTIELGTANDCTKDTRVVLPPLYNSSPSEGSQPPDLYIPSSSDDFPHPRLPTPHNSSADKEIVEEKNMTTPVKEGHYTLVAPAETATYSDSVRPVGFTTVQYDEITEHKNMMTHDGHLTVPSHTGFHRAMGDYNEIPYSTVVSLKPPAAVKDAECVTSDIKDGATVGEILCENLDNDYSTTDVDENKSNVTQESDDTIAAQRNELHDWHEEEQNFLDFYETVQVFPITFDQDFHHYEPAMCSDSSCSNSVMLPGCSSSTIISSFGSYAEKFMTFPKCISVPSNRRGIVFYPKVIPIDTCDGGDKENLELDNEQKSCAHVIAKKLNDIAVSIACSITVYSFENMIDGLKLVINKGSVMTSKFLKCLCDIDLLEFMKIKGSVVFQRVLDWLGDTSYLNAHGHYRRASPEFYTDPGLLRSLKQERMKVEKKPCRKKCEP